jgi:hypothetical protein
VKIGALNALKCTLDYSVKTVKYFITPKQRAHNMETFNNTSPIENGSLNSEDEELVELDSGYQILLQLLVGDHALPNIRVIHAINEILQRAHVYECLSAFHQQVQRLGPEENDWQQILFSLQVHQFVEWTNLLSICNGFYGSIQLSPGITKTSLKK